MNKNFQFIFSILGGLMLMILNIPIFNYMILSLFSNLDSKIILWCFTIVNTALNILSIIGFIVVLINSLRLIVNNIKPLN